MAITAIVFGNFSLRFKKRIIMQKLISVKIKKNGEGIKITKKDLIARECYAFQSQKWFD